MSHTASDGYAGHPVVVVVVVVMVVVGSVVGGAVVTEHTNVRTKV